MRWGILDAVSYPSAAGEPAKGPAHSGDGVPGIAGVDGIEASTGFLLWQVTLAWQRAMRIALDPHDLTHAQFVLLTSVAAVADSDEPATAHSIAEHASIDAVLTGQVLRRLAARQLVVRENGDDPHARLIRITEPGRALLTRAAADVELTDVTFFSALHEDSTAFRRGLSALRD